MPNFGLRASSPVLCLQHAFLPAALALTSVLSVVLVRIFKSFRAQILVPCPLRPKGGNRVQAAFCSSGDIRERRVF